MGEPHHLSIGHFPSGVGLGKQATWSKLDVRVWGCLRQVHPHSPLGRPHREGRGQGAGLSTKRSGLGLCRRKPKTRQLGTDQGQATHKGLSHPDILACSP